MYTLGINLSHHSSIALIKNNEVLLFVTEERINRNKYYRGVPAQSLNFVKNFTNKIDCILLVSGSANNLQTCVEYLQQQNVSVESSRQVNQWHHLAHAAAGFYMSHFDQATIIVVDGAGAMYRINNSVRVSETTSYYEGKFPSIQCTHKRLIAKLNKIPNG